MSKLIIIGAGGHAAELRDYVNHINQDPAHENIEVVGFIEDNKDNYNHYGFSEPLLGGIKEHEIRQDVEYLMGIANLKFKKEITERFLAKGASFKSLIHPRSLVSPSAKLGHGVVISHHASVGPKAEIGDYNFINSRSTIGHDTIIGDFNFISPQVALGGNTQIGDENLLGTNSCTIPGISIGSRNKVGAGMVVFKPVNDDETVFFRFKERIVVRDDEKSKR